MPLLKPIQRIILHCSATPNGRWHTVEDINRWHGPDREQRGLRPFRRDDALVGHNQPNLLHVGYHFVVYTTGVVRIGRGLREMGAHCRGHNGDSIGICLIGTDAFTIQQWVSLQRLVRGMRARFNLADGCVHGHNEYSAKTCPGFDVSVWAKNGFKPLEQRTLEW